LIGEGGMAEVYLARQRGPMNFQKIVVVKTIHPHLARKQKFIKMLLDEATIAALLKHPSVVDIYDLGVEDGTYFIAMEYLAGEPLLSVLRAGVKKKALDIPSTARLISEVADGLHAAHELQDPGGRALELVHRDITPGNIVVLYTGQVKIVDFGIAKARGRLADQTDADHFKGKLGYVAPEQVKGEGIDRRADIFSLGVVMWESLSLRRLFRKDTPAAAAEAILNKNIPPPSKFRSSVPPRLDSICMRALARDPDERYATAAELHEDIERFLAAGSFRPHKATIRKYMQEMFGDNISAREELLRKVADATTSIQVALPQSDDERAETTPGDLPLPHMFTGPVPLVDRASLDEKTPSSAGQVSRHGSAAPVHYGAGAGAGRNRQIKIWAVVATVVVLIIAIAAGSNSSSDSQEPEASSMAAAIDDETPDQHVVEVTGPDPSEHVMVADGGNGSDAGATTVDVAVADPVAEPDAGVFAPIDLTVPDDTESDDTESDDKKSDDKKSDDKKPNSRPHGNPATLYKEGMQLFAQGKTGGARSKFRTAIAIKPNYAEAHRSLGLVYERQGNKKQAGKSFRKYLQLAPKARDRKIIEKKLQALGG
jgi:serine/threonine protein kinase